MQPLEQKLQNYEQAKADFILRNRKQNEQKNVLLHAPVLLLLNIYLFLVHMFLDRILPMIFFLPWQKRTQRHRTVKSKSEYMLLKIFLCPFKMYKSNLTMPLFKVLLACNVYPQILWESWVQRKDSAMVVRSPVSSSSGKKKGQKFSNHVWRCITRPRTKDTFLVVVYFLWPWFFSPK